MVSIDRCSEIFLHSKANNLKLLWPHLALLRFFFQNRLRSSQSIGSCFTPKFSIYGMRIIHSTIRFLKIKFVNCTMQFICTSMLRFMKNWRLIQIYLAKSWGLFRALILEFSSLKSISFLNGKSHQLFADFIINGLFWRKMFFEMKFIFIWWKILTGLWKNQKKCTFPDSLNAFQEYMCGGKYPRFSRASCLLFMKLFDVFGSIFSALLSTQNITVTQRLLFEESKPQSISMELFFIVSW